MKTHTKKVSFAAFGLTALVALGVAWRACASVQDAPRGASATAAPVATSPAASTGEGASPGPDDDGADAGAVVIATPDAGAAALVRAAWGSSRGELGRSRPSEGNPEAPMSFALAGDDLLVVDQVNGRLVRYGADGRVRDTSSIAGTVQDVAVAKNGNVLLLDRLVEKSVTVTDRAGRPVGRIALDAAGVREPGLVTGVFVDGKDVYVEKGHGALLRIGTTDGQPAEGPTELAGRPTKDGTLLLNAAIAGRATGRVVLNAIDRRTSSLRFARAISFPRPLDGLVLLDSDDAGTIYVGAAAGGPGHATIACLDPGDGHTLGFVAVPLSVGADESFRDFSVAGDGTIVFALRTESSVEYRAARCP